MLVDLEQNIQFINRNAAKLSRLVGEFAGSTEMFITMAVDNMEGRDQQILLDNLEAAIVQSGEYDYPEFRERLFAVFSNPAIISYSTKGVSISRNAKKIAGSSGDLRQGIDAARSELGLGKLTREQAALFWKERIYRPAREGLVRPRYFKKNVGYYKGAKRGEKIPFDYASYGIMKYRATIETRLVAWEDKAPFWIWLNYGNLGDGSEYPSVSPTGFVERSKAEINLILEDEILSLTQEFTEALSTEIESFLRNPKAYQPGQELSRFDIGNVRFRLGVTATRELSVRRIS